MTRWQGERSRYERISPEEAHAWLVEEERPAGGPPEIGPLIGVRTPPELLARVDRYARELGTTRAEAIRRLLAQALS